MSPFWSRRKTLADPYLCWIHAPSTWYLLESTGVHCTRTNRTFDRISTWLYNAIVSLICLSWQEQKRCVAMDEREKKGLFNFAANRCRASEGDCIALAHVNEAQVLMSKTDRTIRGQSSVRGTYCHYFVPSPRPRYGEDRPMDGREGLEISEGDVGRGQRHANSQDCKAMQETMEHQDNPWCAIAGWWEHELWRLYGASGARCLILKGCPAPRPDSLAVPSIILHKPRAIHHGC